MKQGSQTSSETQSYQLSDYISNNKLPDDLFAKIYEDIRTRDILSSILINVKDSTVLYLRGKLIDANVDMTDNTVKESTYEDWRSSESVNLANDYDIKRFSRSTRLETLCSKVREHKHYSFIARVKSADGTDRVMKYAFVRLTPDAQFILGTRQEITQSLEHDIVTGGLNREGLLRELTTKFENCKDGIQYSLVCFNIKNFRVINELYGNGIGDKVLQHMYTSIVYSELRPISYARYESDNFICLIYRENLDTDVITRLCYQEYTSDTQKIVYRSICGIYNVVDADVSAFNACSHAKLALTFIKDQFITPWMIYNAEMQKSVISDSEVLTQIDEAMDRKEFIPYFQPVVDVKTGRIEMAEALVRWKSAKHGMVSPGLFIPVLERHGGLSRIDQLMEQSVFNLQQKRLANGRPVVPIDLNLSWVDFSDTRLINQLQDHILDPSVPTDLMRYEITESAFDEIAENRVDVLSFFQQNNVKLLVDDFGQGYSFGTMKNVDFHIIKLDKSLIDKIGKSRKMDLLVETLIGVFHSLNAKVVAEGVEEKEQVEYLKKVGCDYIQGFYFYRPMDEESFLSLLEKQHEETTHSQSSEAEDAAATSESSVHVSSLDDQPAAIWVDREALEHQHARIQQMAEESKSLRLLLDEMDIHIFEWDVKTHEDLASDKFVKMYGLPSNVIPNMPEDIPIVLEDDRDRFRDFYSRIARGEKMGSDCFRLYTPDGNGHTWYRKTFYTLFDSKGMPYKAIITMRDCQDEYRFRMLRTRDRILTQQQEIVTFMYTLNNDTITINFLSKNGEVASASVSDFLKTPAGKLLPDQALIADNLRRIIADGSRVGYFDFLFAPNDAEFRAHYAMVDGEYGHLYAIVGQAEDINKTRERLAAKEQLIRLSEIDGLTQIRNRATGEREMDKALADHEPGVFGLLDCDKFKSVNDTFGHIVGDELLKAIAGVMSHANTNGINMRLGGDEFAFFVKGQFTPAMIEDEMKLFFDAINQLQVPGLIDFPVSISVGAVVYNGEADVSFDDIYRKADILLYKSKKYPGNRLTL